MASLQQPGGSNPPDSVVDGSGMIYSNQGEPWDAYENGYNEAQADLVTKLRAKIRHRELTSVTAIDSYLAERIEKAKEVGRWPPGWEE